MCVRLACCRSALRLIVVDYDGAPSAHQPLAALSAPSEAFKKALAALCRDRGNQVRQGHCEVRVFWGVCFCVCVSYVFCGV